MMLGHGGEEGRALHVAHLRGITRAHLLKEPNQQNPARACYRRVEPFVVKRLNDSNVA